MVIASAFLSQSLVRERMSERERDCKCKKWKAFVIKRKFRWQNCFNRDIKRKTAARVHL